MLQTTTSIKRRACHKFQTSSDCTASFGPPFGRHDSAELIHGGLNIFAVEHTTRQTNVAIQYTGSSTFHLFWPRRNMSSIRLRLSFQSIKRPWRVHRGIALVLYMVIVRLVVCSRSWTGADRANFSRYPRIATW